MEQQLMCLMCYYHLLCSLLFLFYTQKIYFLLFSCYLSYNYLQHNVHLHHHSVYIYGNSANFLMLWNNCHCTNRLYIDITISRFSALSINVLLIFDMHDLNWSTINVSFLFFLLALLVPATVILLFTTIYASL